MPFHEVVFWSGSALAKKTRRCPILAITVRTWRTKFDYLDQTCRLRIDWDLSTPAFHGLLLTKSMHWVYLKSWHDFLPLKYFFDMICCRFHIQPLVAAALYLWTIQTHISSSLCRILLVAISSIFWPTSLISPTLQHLKKSWLHPPLFVARKTPKPEYIPISIPGQVGSHGP